MKTTNFNPDLPFNVATGVTSGTTASAAALTIAEVDGSPSVAGVTGIVVPNGGLTSLGSNVRLEYRARWLNLANRSGGIRTPGDIVIIDTANDESFTTSTSSNTTVPIGVVDETIAIGSNGRIVVEGYAPFLKTLGTSARGDYLFHSTTTATAAHMAGTNPLPGAFGYVLKGGAGSNSSAHIFPTTEASSGAVSYASNSNQVGTANAGGASLLVSRADHVHRGVHSISHSSNTFYGDVTLTTSGTLGITVPAPGTFNLSAGTGGGGGGSITVSENFLTSPVTIAATNTFYDGPSLSLAAGTYLLDAIVTIDVQTANHLTVKIWDGTTLRSATPETFHGTNGGQVALACHGYVVLGATTTVKVSVAANNGTNNVIDNTGATNSTTNKASYLRATKIA
jgi:hypothetical protein